MNSLVDIADALVAELDAAIADGFFLVPFAPVRQYVPDESIEDETLRVIVMATSSESKALSRTEDEGTLGVQVVITKKLSPIHPDGLSIDEQADQMMDFVEQLKRWIRWDGEGRRRRLSQAPEASYASMKHVPAYSPGVLKQNHEFFSVLTVSYRVREGA